ncbi:unnamed protein product, partial [Mesorhabditis belari]|uniref:Uncharacterized protein n=1 Tax=Mesorhabditis belari TaxID=2138241 RepID=A0AAF3EB80_9BILA
MRSTSDHEPYDAYRRVEVTALSRLQHMLNQLGVDEKHRKMEDSTTSSEIVYGGGSPLAEANDASRPMSDKVQAMAASIYREFEQMIKKFGEDSVKTLMPLVVNVLENLDLSFLEKEEMSVDYEMLKEDNEQLVTQYERERQQRKQQDQKYMEIEDSMIGQQKELEGKIASLESIMRMLELKAKNAADHSNRLEEREADQKADFDRLHERYNVLLRTHIDHMERTKYLLGNDKFEMMQNMPLPNQAVRSKMGMGMAASVDASSIRGVSDLISAAMTHSISHDVNLANHISNEVDYQEEFGQSLDVETPREGAESGRSVQQELEPSEEPNEEMRTSLHNPAMVHETEPEDALGADLTGNLVDPAEFASAVNDTFIGMGREVENLIKENTELLDMKNALNIVKNDLILRVDELTSEQEILREEVRSLEMVRAKMSEQLQQVEAELKETKRKFAERESENEEELIPLAQRKRFTRSEMQRVLIDRNMYKEKLMELEESLKWSELQRAKKLQQQPAAKQSKGGIWDFFSGLFGDSPSPTSGRQRQRVDDSINRRHKMTKSVEFLDADAISERRAAERRAQYKLVREHVKRDGAGRLQAYGWAIPSTLDNTPSTQVPVPVCCRPVMEHLPQLKVWCATGVILRGGRLPNGTYIGDEPVFVGLTKRMPPRDGHPTDSDHLEQEIERSRALEARDRELSEWEPTSLIWVASSNQGRSQVAIVDANNPNNIIDQFPACDSHLLCMTSVAGVLESDPWCDEPAAKKFLRGGGYLKEIPEGMDHADLGSVSWVEMRKLEESDDHVETLCSNEQKPSPQRVRDFSICEQTAVPGPSEAKGGKRKSRVEEAVEARERTTARPLEKGLPPDEPISPRGSLPTHIRASLARYEQVASHPDTKMPTIWMGSQNQYIYIHSAVTAWRQCLRRIKLPDAVLAITYAKGRVFAALANGTVVVFHRNKQGIWSSEGYHCVRLGPPSASVRALEVVGSTIWAAYKNCVIVIDVDTLHVLKVFAAHPRKDSQVRALQWVGAGVWASIRLDSTLRLYHAYTYDHLQDVDIEPYVTKMLGPSKLDYSYMRTTSLLVSNRRLWIGTGTGVVISVPLSATLDEKMKGIGGADLTAGAKGGPGGLVRVYKNADLPDSAKEKNGELFIPYCNLSNAQLSFHGHKDSVKFFISVPGEDKVQQAQGEEEENEGHLRRMLVISGGDGYIDFRIGDEEEGPQEKPTKDGETGIRVRDMSHLIIWELDAELPVLGT